MDRQDQCHAKTKLDNFFQGVTILRLTTWGCVISGLQETRTIFFASHSLTIWHYLKC